GVTHQRQTGVVGARAVGGVVQGDAGHQGARQAEAGGVTAEVAAVGAPLLVDGQRRANQEEQRSRREEAAAHWTSGGRVVAVVPGLASHLKLSISTVESRISSPASQMAKRRVSSSPGTTLVVV